MCGRKRVNHSKTSLIIYLPRSLKHIRASTMRWSKTYAAATEQAYAATEKDPETLQDALEEVQNSIVNLKAFGRGSARSVLPDVRMMERMT